MMGNLYTGKSKELREAKSKGITEKIKKYLATALMAGSLVAVGSPVYSHDNYTSEQLSKHYEQVEEVKNMYDIIIDEQNKAAKIALENGEISKDFYEQNSLAMDKTRLERDNVVHDLRGKLTNIYDKNLIFMKTLEPKEGDTQPRILLNLNDISSLNKGQIETLEKKYHIDSISLNRYYEIDKGDEAEQQFVYSPETYKQMLDIMEQKFGDLKYNKNLSDLEKVTIVLKRFEGINYDLDALKITDMNDSRVHTSRSMQGPLLKNSGICAGYSDLFKNTMSYLGIESREIRGYVKGIYNPNTFAGQPNHAWNQVKIDNKWFNLDITAIMGQKDMLEPNNPHPYLFTSDSDLKAKRRHFFIFKKGTLRTNFRIT